MLASIQSLQLHVQLKTPVTVQVSLYDGTYQKIDGYSFKEMPASSVQLLVLRAIQDVLRSCRVPFAPRVNVYYHQSFLTETLRAFCTKHLSFFQPGNQSLVLALWERLNETTFSAHCQKHPPFLWKALDVSPDFEYTVFSDAAYFPDTRRSCIAGLIYSRQQTLVSLVQEECPAVSNSTHLEGVALHHMMNLAKEQHLSSALFLTDAKSWLSILENGTRITAATELREQTISLLQAFPGWHIQWVPRKHLTAVHRLCRQHPLPPQSR